MRKALLHPLFIVACALFLINYVLEWQGIFIPYWHSWGDDLLCLPVILTLLNAAFAWCYGVEAVKLNWLHVAIALLIVSLLFEAILPSFSSEYIRDPLDVAAYMLGGICYGMVNFSKKQKPLSIVG